MSTPEPEADRLNAYLDARVRGGPAPATGIEPGLVAAYERLRALDASTAPQPRALCAIGRNVMAEAPALVSRQAAPVVSLPVLGGARRRRRVLRELVTAVGLVAAVLAVLVATNAVDTGKWHGSEAIPAGSLPAAGTPTATGCLAAPRAPGSVGAIVGTPVMRLGMLPRYNDDPTRLQSKISNGEAEAKLLLGNSAPTDADAAEVEEALQQLVACRFYMLRPEGGTDLDGRFYALFSDDFFRRELSGYREAGKPLDLLRIWSPSAMPEILDLRETSDGRVVATLSIPGWQNAVPNVVIFVREGGRLLVDEVGVAAMPVTQPSPTAESGAPAWTAGVPLRLDLALYDGSARKRASSQDGGETICDPLDRGTPVPCGEHVRGFGPYWYNEFPTGVAITVTLYNFGETAKRFTVQGLGIAVVVAPNGRASVILDAAAGEYLYSITEGSKTIGAGVFTFIPSDQVPSQG